jgi:ubiquinone/menaquinone biosynthesis C-methylase UbiE
MRSSSTFLATDGVGYDLQMGRWSRRLAPLLIDFAGVPEFGRVLDVGCGTGSLTFALADRLREGAVTGIDLSSTYIAHAVEHCRDPRVCFEVGDATDLHFADQSFDHVLSSLVLQFIPGADRAVSQMHRVTRSGGTVAAATWDTRGGVVARRMFFDTAAVIDPEAARRRAADCARPMSSKDGLAKTWSDAGLVDIEVGSLTIRMDYGSFLDFWSSIDGRDGPIAAYLNSLATETKVTLRRLVEAAYLDGESDGPRSYAATAWAVKGRVP